MLSKYYDVTLIANGSNKDFIGILNDNIHFIPLRIDRKVKLLGDLSSLVNLFFIFYKERFDVVHSLMPKSSILAMLAAFFSGVPYRIHTFTGQVWANKNGFKKFTLKTFDRLVVYLSTNLLADSFSQRNFLIKERIVACKKIKVLANGSVSGVNLNRFKFDRNMRSTIRNKFNIASASIIFLYLGRLNKDKGILDFAYAFSEIALSLPELHFVVVGNDEEGINGDLIKILSNCKNQFHRIPFTNCPHEFMSASDIICLPSYREGFGSVLIEAAAVGLPAIASNIYGINDAVVDGETGILHEPKNHDEIKRAIITLTNNKKLRISMSIKAKLRAQQYFSEKLVVNAMRDFYFELL
jgi:glycosyltransferase involved in cell wall biosynthesis